MQIDLPPSERMNFSTAGSASSMTLRHMPGPKLRSCLRSAPSVMK